MKRDAKGKKAALAAVLLIAAAGVLMWIVYFPSGRKEETGSIAQAYAAKAAASLLTDTARREADETLPDYEEGTAWYEPYIEYLVSRGYWESGGEDSAGEASYETAAQRDLTWRQVRLLVEGLNADGRLTGQELLDRRAASGEWDDRSLSRQEWWDFFEELVQALGCESYQMTEITVYGTDQTVDIPAGRVSTSEGQLFYGGFAMEDYIDRTIQVRFLGRELLDVLEVTQTTVIYENVWLNGSTAENLSVFMEGFYRDFAVAGLSGDYQNVLADLTLEEGQVTHIAVKRDRIAGKVLTVRSDYIEIQGYGKVPVSDSVRVYKVYDGLELRSLADIVVGYSVHEFIVADGEICGALALENIDVETIRVLISNNGFAGSGHDTVSLASDAPLRITIDGETSEWPAGTDFTVTPESAEFERGRIIVESDAEIRITSLERSYGVPSYKGSIELAVDEGQILVVNEVGLEDYLCRVVPSEMPAGHGLEALKAQAVCARSYAYNQIRANACRDQGAHVDDTTKYQVYNNSDEKELCSQAVMETAGRVLTYGGDVITAYYSSTTCGSSTDTSIWGSSPAEYPYLIARMLSLSDEQPDLTDEETFRAFIKNPDYETFDTDFAWYRWNLYADLTTLSNAINESLAALGEDGSAYVLVQDESGEFVQQPISSIGAVTSMTVTARGAGGIVSEMLIEGTEATIRLLRQGNVRSYLGSRDYVITKKDGSTVDGMSSLPSAFICLEEVREGDNLTGYQIYGGGYGHGVGMSQNGAKTMASQGMSCEEILQFFYPGTELKSIYEG